jgi:hypothetical protein
VVVRVTASTLKGKRVRRTDAKDEIFIMNTKNKSEVESK